MTDTDVMIIENDYDKENSARTPSPTKKVQTYSKYANEKEKYL